MTRPKVTIVRTRDNLFQHLEVLTRNREKRHRYGEFLVEGVLAIQRLLRFGWTVRAWVFSKQRGLSSWGDDILRSSSCKVHFELSPELLAELSAKEDASELMAVVEIPPDDVGRCATRLSDGQPLLVAAFDRPQSPGNLGTSLRSCDALGVHAVFILGHAVDLYDPETVRASVGSLFAVPTIRISSGDDLVRSIKSLTAQAVQYVGTSAQGAVELHSSSLTTPTVLLFGNEKQGLSRGLKELSTSLVTIPQRGIATSLNVSCAVSIVLYEVDKQRRVFARQE